MGLRDLFNRKKAALPQANMEEKIEVVAAKVKGLSKELNEVKEVAKVAQEEAKAAKREASRAREELNRNKNERNKCINLYSRYEPSKLRIENEDKNGSLIPRTLNSDSEYKHTISLKCGIEDKDELIMALFNKEDYKEVLNVFREALKFQENLQYGGIGKDVINKAYKEVKKYAQENNITITPEGEEVLNNTKEDFTNISKTVFFSGDTNTVERAIIIDNKDVNTDMSNYTIDELEYISNIDENVVNKITGINKEKNIDNVIKENQDIIKKYLDKNSTAMGEFKRLHRNSIEADILLDAIKYIEIENKNFSSTNEHNYMRLFCEGKEKNATKFYKRR